MIHNLYTTILLKPAPRMYGWLFLALHPRALKITRGRSSAMTATSASGAASLRSTRGFRHEKTLQQRRNQKPIRVGEDNHRAVGYQDICTTHIVVDWSIIGALSCWCISKSFWPTGK